MAKPAPTLQDQVALAAKWLHHCYVNGNLADLRTALLELRGTGALLILVVAELMDVASDDERQDLLRTFARMLEKSPPRTGRRLVAELARLWQVEIAP